MRNARLFALILVVIVFGAAFLTQSNAQVTTQIYDLTVGVGQIGQVRLPVNPSTGCSWWIEPSSARTCGTCVDISTSGDIDPTIDCGNPPRPGCSNAIVVYAFKPNVAGDYTIELRYGHAWAHNEYYMVAIVHLSVPTLTTTVTGTTYTIGQPISSTGVLGIGNNGWFSVIENTENSYLLDFTHSLPCVTENGVIVCPSGLWNSPQQSDLGKTIYVSGTFNMVAGCAAPPGPCVGGPAIIVQSWYFIAPACPPYQCPVGQVQDPVSCQCKSQTTSTTTTMMTSAVQTSAVQTTSAVLTLTTLSNGAICWVDANHPDQPLCTGVLGPSSNPIVKVWNGFWNWLRCLFPGLGPCLPQS